MSEFDSIKDIVEKKPKLYNISIKYNPAFATEDEIIKVDSIIVNGKEIIKNKRKFWSLFGLKFKYTVEDYKKKLKIEDLEVGNMILIFEKNYPDRWYGGNGHFIKLKAETVNSGELELI